MWFLMKWLFSLLEIWKLSDCSLCISFTRARVLISRRIWGQAFAYLYLQQAGAASIIIKFSITSIGSAMEELLWKKKKKPWSMIMFAFELLWYRINAWHIKGCFMDETGFWRWAFTFPGHHGKHILPCRKHSNAMPPHWSVCKMKL